MASSFVSTSPLAVTTVVGFLETFTVSTSAELRSFLLNICLLACLLACSAVHHKISFLRLYCGCGRQNPLIGRRKECCFALFIELLDMLGKFPTRLRGFIASVFQCPPEICPQISRRRDCADENLWLVFYSAMDLCFLGCWLDAAQLLWIMLVELITKLLCPSEKPFQILAAQRPVTRNLTVVHFSQKLLHVTTLLRPFVGLFLKLPVRKWALCAEFTIRF